MITYRPSLDLLLAYAAGQLPEAVRLAVAAHLDLCPQSRRTVAEMEAVAGAMLDAIPPVETSPSMLPGILDLLDAEEAAMPAAAPKTIENPVNVDAFLPATLARRLGRPMAELAWQRVAGLFDEAILPDFASPYRVSLIRAKQGESVPMHKHAGEEYLVVLAGGLSAGDLAFERGDFAYTEAGGMHEPVVDSDEECLCLLVLDAPLIFSGPHAADLDAIFRH